MATFQQWGQSKRVGGSRLTNHSIGFVGGHTDGKVGFHCDFAANPDEKRAGKWFGVASVDSFALFQVFHPRTLLWGKRNMDWNHI
jgi:hypothetical protein